MNVAIIGSGGREHALGWKIKQSKKCDGLFFIPGNGGTGSLGVNLKCDVKNFHNVLKLLNENQIQFVVVGPEQPLVDGLSDFLRENGIKVFGPSKAAAQIEASKFFAKKIMKMGNVPTADFKIFSLKDRTEINNYISQVNFPVVIKADGLAAGKGVKVCTSKVDAKNFIIELEKEIIGNVDSQILVEQFMEGDEASIFAITDGSEFIILPPAQDHKRIGDGDSGDNTGGMGAYAPTALVNEQMMEEVASKIIEPTLRAMRENGTPFSGCLYAGLMLTNEGPKAVEFNCRFGDPETQVVLPIIEGDLLELLFSSSVGELNKKSVKYNSRSAICVIAASYGYPKKFEKGFVISGLDEVGDGTTVFHSGTKLEHDSVLSNGGRVVGVTFCNESNDLNANIEAVYRAIEKIKFENIYLRKDIGQKGLRYLSKRN